MVLLGILGFDPGPMLISIAALSLGARRRDILIFAAALVGGTAVWGSALSVVAGPAVRRVHWLILAESPVGLTLAAVAAVALVAWGVVSLLRRGRSGGPGRTGDLLRRDTRTASRMAAGLVPLMLVALVFVAVVISDPPFPAAVVLSAHQPVAVVVLGFLLWAVVSQSPLVVLAVALAAGVGDRAVTAARELMTRVTPLASLVLSVACLLGGLALGAWVVVRLVA